LREKGFYPGVEWASFGLANASNGKNYIEIVWASATCCTIL
jgi:hypothetical protein